MKKKVNFVNFCSKNPNSVASNYNKNKRISQLFFCRAHKQIMVTVHYEMYQGLPLVSKWVTLEYKTALKRKFDSKTADGQGVRAEILAVEKLCTNWQWSQQGNPY